MLASACPLQRKGSKGWGAAAQSLHIACTPTSWWAWGAGPAASWRWSPPPPPAPQGL